MYRNQKLWLGAVGGKFLPDMPHERILVKFKRWDRKANLCCVTIEGSGQQLKVPLANLYATSF